MVCAGELEVSGEDQTEVDTRFDQENFGGQLPRASARPFGLK